MDTAAMGRPRQALATSATETQTHAIGDGEREELGSERCEPRSEAPRAPELQDSPFAERASSSDARGDELGIDGASEFAEDDTQLAAIRELMTRASARGVWLTLGEIAEATEFAEASISAQLRHLRKAHNGGHRVVKRHRAAPGSAAIRQVRNARRGPVIWEYRVLPRY